MIAIKERVEKRSRFIDSTLAPSAVASFLAWLDRCLLQHHVEVVEGPRLRRRRRVALRFVLYVLFRVLLKAQRARDGHLRPHVFRPRLWQRVRAAQQMRGDEKSDPVWVGILKC